MARIKHCFRRREIYHQWIHNNGEYCYTNERLNVTGEHDMLFISTFKSNTREFIVNNWNGYIKEKCLAIINREYKLIFVSTKNTRFYNEILRDIPDYYQVFQTNDYIENPNILSTGDVSEVIKCHSKFLLTRFVEGYLFECYMVLKDNKKTLNIDYNLAFTYNKRDTNDCILAFTYNKYITDYNNIFDFVKQYKIKKLDWYNKKSFGNIKLKDYFSWDKITNIVVELPSLKQVITNKVFTPSEKIKLNQAYFYKQYCYGNGISFKTVKSRWFDSYDRNEFEKMFKKVNITINLNDRPKLLLWKDGIELYSKALEANRKESINKALDKSAENYRKALSKLNEEVGYTALDSWRNFKHFASNFSVEYEKFIPNYRKNGYGTWTTATLRFNKSFPNTKLRLKDNTIETSRGAKVSLDDAIRMYKLFTKVIADDKPSPGTKILHNLTSMHFRVGLYPLTDIQYKQKTTDNYEDLDKWEYVVVIGCHHLWMDDFYEFVDYYGLYDKFEFYKFK